MAYRSGASEQGHQEGPKKDPSPGGFLVEPGGGNSAVILVERVGMGLGIEQCERGRRANGYKLDAPPQVLGTSHRARVVWA